MDWVHCNLCFKQPGDTEGRKFCITNCGHIYCTICIESGKLEVCHICRTGYTSIPLNPQMNYEVEAYFLDPIEIIRKQSVVLEFQHNHRMRLVKYNKAIVTKYDSLKEENASLKQEIKYLKEELYLFKRKYFKLEKEFNRSPNMSQSPTNKPMKNYTMIVGSQKHFPSNSLPENFELSPVNKEIRKNVVLKRPCSMNPNLFSSDVNKKEQSQEKKNHFTPPFPPKNTLSYRYSRQTASCESTPAGLTPNFSSPSTSESVRHENLQRRVKLPGDKSGPSPCTKIGLHRLSLGVPRATSTPITSSSSTTINKYSKYF